MKVQEHLNKDNWTKHTSAKDRFGTPCGPRSEAACSWCLLGSILVCYGGDYRKITEKIYNHLNDLVSDFNDRSTWEQVESLIKELDI